MEDSRRREAARLYACGLTAREVAAEVGIDNTTVLRWVRDDDDHGGTRRRGPRGYTDIPDAQIVELRDSYHLGWRALAATVGMSRSGVQARYLRATTGRRWR